METILVGLDDRDKDNYELKVYFSMMQILEYKKRLNGIKTSFSSKESKVHQLKKEGLIMGGGNSLSNEESVNQRMLGNAKHLSDGVTKLESAKRMAYETEDIAINIQNELKGQTDKINDMIGKNKDIRADLGIADKVIGKISKRNTFDKIVLYVIVFVVLVAIIVLLILYFKK